MRSQAMHIACEIHPLNNLRVLQYLSAELGVDDEAKNAGTGTGSRRDWRRWSKGWKPLVTSVH